MRRPRRCKKRCSRRAPARCGCPPGRSIEPQSIAAYSRVMPSLRNRSAVISLMAVMTGKSVGAISSTVSPLYPARCSSWRDAAKSRGPFQRRHPRRVRHHRAWGEEADPVAPQTPVLAGDRRHGIALADGAQHGAADGRVIEGRQRVIEPEHADVAERVEDLDRQIRGHAAASAAGRTEAAPTNQSRLPARPQPRSRDPG